MLFQCSQHRNRIEQFYQKAGRNERDFIMMRGTVQELRGSIVCSQVLRQCSTFSFASQPHITQKHLKGADCLCRALEPHRHGEIMEEKSEHASKLHLSKFEKAKMAITAKARASGSTYLDIGLGNIGRLGKLASGTRPREYQIWGSRLTSPLTMILLEAVEAAAVGCTVLGAALGALAVFLTPPTDGLAAARRLLRWRFWRREPTRSSRDLSRLADMMMV